MTEEFNLSEKIENGIINDIGYFWINQTDVKEFIKRLKEEVKNDLWFDDKGDSLRFNKIIDKLAGEKLV